MVYNYICKIVLRVPIYYEICYDDRYVYYKTTSFQLVLYMNTTNPKYLLVWYRRGDEVWQQSWLVLNILEQEHVYLLQSNFLLTTEECNWHALLFGIRRTYIWHGSNLSNNRLANLLSQYSIYIPMLIRMHLLFLELAILYAWDIF